MNKVHLLGLNSTWVLKQEFISLKRILIENNYSIKSSKFAYNSVVYLSSK